MVNLTSKIRSRGAIPVGIAPRGGEAAVVVLQRSTDGGSIEDGDDTANTTATVVKTEVALSSSNLVATAGPIGQGGADANRGAGGRNKKKGRLSPASAEDNTDATSSLGNHSSKTTTRGGDKRARRTVDDDVAVLEADDHPRGASGSAARQGAAVVGPRANVSVKPEH